jgi:hypothetical protein
MPSPDVEKRRQYWRDYYYRYPEKAREVRTRKKRELMAWFQELKSQQVCARCGESDPACLDFHHLDGAEKSLTLGELRSHGWSKERVLAELGRCIVFCANCHRKFHAGRFELAELISASSASEYAG